MAGQMFGVYRGVIVDTHDPQSAGRVKVRLASLPAADLWAATCIPFGHAIGTPQVGRNCWVAFEGGDASRPVCLGHSPG